MNPTIPTDQARQTAFQQTLLSARRTMLFSETLKLAIDSFRASKMRFALTALGMVIGTASVILVITIGLTGQEFVLQELQKIETNAIELEYSGGGATAAERVLYNDSMTREDEKAVLAQLPGVEYSSPIAQMHDRISFGGGVTKDTLVLGVSPQYQHIRNLLVPFGRFFDQEDDAAHIKCAVVSELFARDRFGSDDAAIGRTFEVSRIPFTIVGVFKEAVPDFGNSEIEDQTILIPYSVARYFTGSDNVQQIYFSMRSMNEVTDAAKEIVRIIHLRHRRDSVYKAQTLQEYLTIAHSITTALTLLLDCRQPASAAGGGRRGHYEHHAGRCAGARARDRHPQSSGGHAARDQAAVPYGGRDHLAYRRFRRHHRRPGAACIRARDLPISPSPSRRGRWSSRLPRRVFVRSHASAPSPPRAAQLNPVDALKYE